MLVLSVVLAVAAFEDALKSFLCQVAETVVWYVKPSDALAHLSNNDAFIFELFREAAMPAHYNVYGVHHTITLPRFWFL